MLRIKELSDENKRIFREVYKEVKLNSRFELCNEFTSHGSTSVKEHVIMVTLLALNLSEKFHLKIDKRQLIKGALLHDYYLYDWHDKQLKELHGFRHPKKALIEALKDFELTEVEMDIILHHMFPLTSDVPWSKEGRLLCIADKICALGETIDGKLELLKI